MAEDVRQGFWVRLFGRKSSADCCSFEIEEVDEPAASAQPAEPASSADPGAGAAPSGEPSEPRPASPCCGGSPKELSSKRRNCCG